eukprot:3805528-Pleurochrysis_carterae.AAC.1
MTEGGRVQLIGGMSAQDACQCARWPNGTLTCARLSEFVRVKCGNRNLSAKETRLENGADPRAAVVVRQIVASTETDTMERAASRSEQKSQYAEEATEKESTRVEREGETAEEEGKRLREVM